MQSDKTQEWSAIETLRQEYVGVKTLLETVQRSNSFCEREQTTLFSTLLGILDSAISRAESVSRVVDRKAEYERRRHFLSLSLWAMRNRGLTQAEATEYARAKIDLLRQAMSSVVLSDEVRELLSERQTELNDTAKRDAERIGKLRSHIDLLRSLRLLVSSYLEVKEEV